MRQSIAQLAAREKSGQPAKTARSRIGEVRKHKIRKAAREFWKGKLNGKPITRRQVAEKHGLEPNALSKKVAQDLCMARIEREVKEALKTFKLISKIDPYVKNRLLRTIEEATIEL